MTCVLWEHVWLLLWPESTADLSKCRERNPGIVFVVDGVRCWKSFLQCRKLRPELWFKSVLSSEGKQLGQEVMDSPCRTVMDLVDMPMHKGSHERYIKEVVKSNGSKALDVMEKAKICLE